ncbi:MAG: YeeE/YedE family protein [Bermanella sp.]
MNQKIIALIAGLLFGAGLAASGMTDSNVVQGFLDMGGDWNPSLMFVMATGLMVTLPGFQYFLRRKPIFAPDFKLPTLKDVDRPLVIGSCLFGMGWALVGYCPGPAVAALGYLHWEGVVFVLAMLVGGKARQWQNAIKTN